MSKLYSIYKTTFIPKRQFSFTSVTLARKPPKEEYENNAAKTRKNTADPFDRRWKWTAKLAEPYNIRGGDIQWTKMKINHRGVQQPGYNDPVTKKFIFVKEMVPEIIVPDLKDCQLKPYVPYNAPDFENPVFDARQLYEKAVEGAVVNEFIKEKNKKIEKNE